MSDIERQNEMEMKRPVPDILQNLAPVTCKMCGFTEYLYQANGRKGEA